MSWKIKVIFICFVFITGCLKIDSLEEKNEDNLEFENINWITIQRSSQTPGNHLLKVIGDQIKVNFNITWIPSNLYYSTIRTSLLSMGSSHIITITENQLKDPYVRNAIKSGMFWEIGSLINDFKNLSNLNEDILNNTRIDGKLYGLYHYQYLSRGGLIFRQDWLDNLELQPPQTLDQLYDVLRAFTYDDPNGSGRQDTFGLAERDEFAYSVFKQLAVWFGAPNEWGLRNGELLPDFMHPEYMTTMQFMRKLYEEKIINRDFPVTSSTQQSQLILDNKVGVYVGAMANGITFQRYFDEKGIKAEFDIIHALNGPKGLRSKAGPGHSGIHVFSKNMIKTNEDLIRILNYFDKMLEPEIADIFVNGIEDIHYIENNDLIYLIDDELTNSDLNQVKTLRTAQVEFDTKTTVYENDLTKKYYELLKENEEIAVYNPIFSLDSRMYDSHGLELQKIIEDATVRYILGVIDEDEFNLEVENWKTSGGITMINEYNLSYLRSKQ